VNILSGNSYLSIQGESGAWYKYAVRKPFNRGRKGLFYVTVKIDEVWQYVGFFRKSSCTLARGYKGKFSREHEVFETMRKYLVSMKEKWHDLQQQKRSEAT
jgi:FAD/FMN-containing dehydrogenase